MASQELADSTLDLVDLNQTMSYEEVIRRSNEVDPTILDRYIYNRAIDEPAYTILILTYCILILVGALGNTLVVSFWG